MSALAALQEIIDRKKEQPESAERLLILCCSMYLKAREVCYENYMEGGFALFTAWYINCTKFDSVNTFNYPISVYPTVCICGNTFNSSGSYLRRHCSLCMGDNSKHLIDSYEIQRIAMHTKVNQEYLESIFAKVIYHGYF